MEFVPALAILSLVKKVNDFLKYVSNRDLNGALTQMVVWASGISVMLLAGAMDWAEGIEVGGQVLGDLNLTSIIFVGLSLSSSGSVLYDFQTAIDNHDSAASYKLLGRDRPRARRRSAPLR
jgi:hypothetical protein